MKTIVITGSLTTCSDPGFSWLMLFVLWGFMGELVCKAMVLEDPLRNGLNLPKNHFRHRMHLLNLVDSSVKATWVDTFAPAKGTSPEAVASRPCRTNES